MASIARPPESDRPPLHLCSFELLLGWVAAALSTDASASPPAAAAATLLLRVLVVALASPCSVALLRVVALASCYELVAQELGWCRFDQGADVSKIIDVPFAGGRGSG